MENLVAGNRIIHHCEGLEGVIRTITDEDRVIISCRQLVHEVGPQFVLTIEFPYLSLVMELDQAEDGDVPLSPAVMIEDFWPSLGIVVLPGNYPSLILEELGVKHKKKIIIVPSDGEAKLIPVVNIVEPVAIEVGDDSLLAIATSDEVINCQIRLVEDPVD